MPISDIDDRFIVKDIKAQSIDQTVVVQNERGFSPISLRNIERLR